MSQPAPIPMGIGLTREVLASMGEEERSFWLAFLEDIQQLLDDLSQSGKEMILTSELRERYRIAVQQYDGLKYCQLQQIRELFNVEG